MMPEIMPCSFFVSTELSARFTGIHVRSFFANKKEKKREDVNHRDTEKTGNGTEKKGNAGGRPGCKEARQAGPGLTFCSSHQKWDREFGGKGLFRNRMMRMK